MMRVMTVCPSQVSLCDSLSSPSSPLPRSLPLFLAPSPSPSPLTPLSRSPAASVIPPSLPPLSSPEDVEEIDDNAPEHVSGIHEQQLQRLRPRPGGQLEDLHVIIVARIHGGYHRKFCAALCLLRAPRRAACLCVCIRRRRAVRTWRSISAAVIASSN